MHKTRTKCKVFTSKYVSYIAHSHTVAGIYSVNVWSFILTGTSCSLQWIRIAAPEVSKAEAGYLNPPWGSGETLFRGGSAKLHVKVMDLTLTNVK